MSDGEDCGGVIAAPAPSRRRNRKLWKTSVRLVLEKQPRSVRQEVMIETEEIEASDINQVKFEKKQVSMNLKKDLILYQFLKRLRSGELQSSPNWR